MAEYPHLTRAPITEAVIDVRVEQRPETTLASFDLFAQQVIDAFPDTEVIQRRQVEFSGVDMGVKSSTTLGKVFWTKTKDQAVQARLDGFSYNIIKHYDNWAAHRDQARRLWERYRVAAQPVLIKRCALRYINKISIRVGDDIRDYVRVFPHLPAEVFGDMEEYLMKLVVPFDDDRRCTITQVLPNPADAPTGNLILDLDVFVDRDFSPDSDDLWGEFEVLHDLKNRCFFGSMQPVALEAYK